MYETADIHDLPKGIFYPRVGKSVKVISARVPSIEPALLRASGHAVSPATPRGREAPRQALF